MPTVQIPSTAYDGFVSIYPVYFSYTWAQAIAGTGATPSGDSASAASTLCCADKGVSATFCWGLHRGHLFFDTSSLPDGAVITDAKLYLYVTLKESGAGGSVCLVGSTASPTTNLSASDFGAVGTTEYATRASALGGAATTFANFAANAWNAITLNAAGIAAITDSGYTKLALRSSHDLDASEPGVDLRSLITVRATDYTGTDYDPYLEVTYTLSGGGAMRQRNSGLMVPGRFVR